MKRFLPKRKPVFTAEQFNRLSNIFDNAGQVLLGVAVLTPIISRVDSLNIFAIILGAVGVIVCWTTSIRLSRKRKML